MPIHVCASRTVFMLQRSRVVWLHRDCMACRAENLGSLLKKCDNFCCTGIQLRSYVDLIFVILLNSYSLGVSMQIVLLLFNPCNLLFMFPVICAGQDLCAMWKGSDLDLSPLIFIYPQVGLLWFVVEYSVIDEGSCLLS